MYLRVIDDTEDLLYSIVITENRSYSQVHEASDDQQIKLW
jgi:hypothetical protein